MELALDIFQQSLKFSRDVRNFQSQAATLHGIGRIYALQGNVKAAVYQFDQSLDLAKRSGSIKDEAATLHEKAELYF